MRALSPLAPPAFLPHPSSGACPKLSSGNKNWAVICPRGRLRGSVSAEGGGRGRQALSQCCKRPRPATAGALTCGCLGCGGAPAGQRMSRDGSFKERSERRGQRMPLLAGGRARGVRNVGSKPAAGPLTREQGTVPNLRPQHDPQCPAQPPQTHDPSHSLEGRGGAGEDRKGAGH